MAASEVNGDPASWLSGQSGCRLFNESGGSYRKGLRERLSWLVGNRQHFIMLPQPASSSSGIKVEQVV